ncbi:hypothetical protein L917_16646 [Phytophthora nicotianae]|uniref:Uncharacterized protein n=1 Tax=Phytophthora nicotianae TaxID=4792 RepID=W2KFL1_PHYNI|nr:hypothetical protein L917_16646 [Phytophthora nicotianae]
MKDQLAPMWGFHQSRRRCRRSRCPKALPCPNFPTNSMKLHFGWIKWSSVRWRESHLARRSPGIAISEDSPMNISPNHASFAFFAACEAAMWQNLKEGSDRSHLDFGVAIFALEVRSLGADDELPWSFDVDACGFS